MNFNLSLNLLNAFLQLFEFQVFFYTFYIVFLFEEI